MSTLYHSKEPTTVEELAEKCGWTRFGQQQLTDGRNFAQVEEFTYEGKTYVAIERFGGNNLHDLVADDSIVSEHDDEFWELPWNEVDED